MVLFSGVTPKLSPKKSPITADESGFSEHFWLAEDPNESEQERTFPVAASKTTQILECF